MITIHPLHTSDEAPWRQLWKAYLAFYETELPDEIYAATFARLTDPEITDYHGLLALSEDRSVGLVHYLYHRHGWQIEDVCYLQDLFVDPDLRGTGAGRALIEAVYAGADANGTPNVDWMTQNTNTTARRLYDRIGAPTPFLKYRRSAP